MNATAFSASSWQRVTIGYWSAGRETDAWIRVVICGMDLGQGPGYGNRGGSAISYHKTIPGNHDLVITVRFWSVLFPPISQLEDRALDDFPHVVLGGGGLLGDLRI